MAFDVKEFEINSLTVALDKDYTLEEVQGLIECIKTLKQVCDVTYKKVDITDFVAKRRLKSRLDMCLDELFKNE